MERPVSTRSSVDFPEPEAQKRDDLPGKYLKVSGGDYRNAIAVRLRVILFNSPRLNDGVGHAVSLLTPV